VLKELAPQPKDLEGKLVRRGEKTSGKDKRVTRVFVNGQRTVSINEEEIKSYFFDTDLTVDGGDYMKRGETE